MTVRNKNQLLFSVTILFVCLFVLAALSLLCGGLFVAALPLATNLGAEVVSLARLHKLKLRPLAPQDLSPSLYEPGCPAAGGILVPQLGTEPISLALEGGLLNTGPPREVPRPLCFVMWFLVQQPEHSWFLSHHQ